jgi:MFS transporter, ACS family, glucarate transporter
MAVAFSYFYSIFFFQSWFHTFLVKGHGYSEGDLLLSTLPYLVAACANGCGGVASSALARRLGLKWGRRSIGLLGLGSATIFTVAVPLTQEQFWVLIFLSLLLGGITLQQPAICAVCLDIGGKYAGALTGAFNTASQVGSLVSSVVFGYLVNRYANYNAPFIPMAVLLFIGTLLWFKIDPTRELITETQGESASAARILSRVR